MAINIKQQALSTLFITACVSFTACNCRDALDRRFPAIHAAENREVQRASMTSHQVLELLLKPDDKTINYSIRNSVVLIESSGIDQVAEHGYPNIPVLLQIMHDEHISFDTFVRCYSACQAILTPDDSSRATYWDGGAEVVQHSDYEFRFVPNGQIDDATFRHLVTEDIERRYRSVASE